MLASEVTVVFSPSVTTVLDPLMSPSLIVVVSEEPSPYSPTSMISPTSLATSSKSSAVAFANPALKLPLIVPTLTVVSLESRDSPPSPDKVSIE